MEIREANGYSRFKRRSEQDRTRLLLETTIYCRPMKFRAHETKLTKVRASYRSRIESVSRLVIISSGREFTLASSRRERTR